MIFVSFRSLYVHRLDGISALIEPKQTHFIQNPHEIDEICCKSLIDLLFIGCVCIISHLLNISAVYSITFSLWTFCNTFSFSFFFFFLVLFLSLCTLHLFFISHFFTFRCLRVCQICTIAIRYEPICVCRLGMDGCNTAISVILHQPEANNQFKNDDSDGDPFHSANM